MTDILDGYLARRFNHQSLLGAQLDSLADIIVFGFVIFYTTSHEQRYFYSYKNLLLILFILKTMAILITFIRFKIICIIHTYGNKLLGGLIFSVPFLLVYKLDSVEEGIIITAFVVIIEELFISILSKECDPNRKSIMSNNKEKLR
jgi:CDP-diacylglycerol--glycerol-3-phosphate 3-phosphatidyltransferase